MEIVRAEHSTSIARNTVSSSENALRCAALQAIASLLQVRLLLMRGNYAPDSILSGRLAQLRKVAQSVAAWSQSENSEDQLVGDVVRKELSAMAHKHGLPLPGPAMGGVL